MNTKASKVKKILAVVAVAAVLLGLTVFGFHFSCRLKAEGSGSNHHGFAKVTVMQDALNIRG